MAEKKVFRIAVIGAGRIGKVHAMNIHQHPETVVHYVVDPFAEEAANSLADRVGAQVVEPERVFADESIDAVVICSATPTHSDLIEKSLLAGKAVFCEKPIDLSIERVNAVLEKTRNCTAPFLLGFNRRFDPAAAEMQARVRAGDIGDVELVTVISKDPEAPPIEYVRESGGLFRDMTIHDFDMARFLLGEEPDSVVATAAALTSEGIAAEKDIDTACVTLQCPSGRMAVITNSRRASFGYDQRIEVHGSLGSLRTENVPTSTLVLERAEGVRRETPMHFFIERYRDAYRLEWEHFVDVLNGKAEPCATGIDGQRALLIANAAYRSLETGKRELI
ncbi:inositol 2-dehydrogenase [Granulosicoccus antarcticus]|uniref:Inositol 2-dehydrogenase n=1 Tax=Granulosicoccus antarcticus IMCC3135 TaxID=1192854 RepID=A0A2Z2NJT5_9GAMM|nr:inositol 2-dehydrogenase [Granulosicoccus antarcticus]ASJ71373.1 Inositol 2-dehydrogenase [Granulosicoccus antarcticus IMCC3135]